MAEILKNNHTIESPCLIEDMLKLFESAYNSFNELMPRDCYEQFNTCLLRFLNAVSFGDKINDAFSLWVLSGLLTA